MSYIPKERRSLLASGARLQAPWIKVTLGNYTFGVFSTRDKKKDASGMYTSYKVQYPSYVKSLNIIKINGQINQYSLTLEYPVRSQDDPNLIEKILSSVTRTRKIIFSYGDATNPAYVYKEEEAIITKVTQQFNMETSVIQYEISAVSACALASSGSFTFINTTKKKPSDEIKRLLRDDTYGLRTLLRGITDSNINQLIDGTDQSVMLDTKTNISPLEYINYLVSCMIPAGASADARTKDLYILTLHDETVFDTSFSDSTTFYGGPYLKVTRVSTNTLHISDAYEIDVGINTSSIVLGFSIENNENYAMLYDYNAALSTEQYNMRLNDSGKWEQTFAPMFTSGNNQYLTRPEDRSWFTKLTKYPISATIKVQGLLRPASLLQFVRLNVIFPGGNYHISSGLYIVTKQVDNISASGYTTTLSMTRLSD